MITVKPVGEDEGVYVYRLEIPTGDGFEIKYMKCSSCKFRPLPTEEEVEREKILEAWKGQSLENAHDTEASVLTVGEMIDFMMAYRQESE